MEFKKLVLIGMLALSTIGGLRAMDGDASKQLPTDIVVEGMLDFHGTFNAEQALLWLKAEVNYATSASADITLEKKFLRRRVIERFAMFKRHRSAAFKLLEPLFKDVTLGNFSFKLKSFFATTDFLLFSFVFKETGEVSAKNIVYQGAVDVWKVEICSPTAGADLDTLSDLDALSEEALLTYEDTDGGAAGGRIRRQRRQVTQAPDAGYAAKAWTFIKGNPLASLMLIRAVYNNPTNPRALLASLKTPAILTLLSKSHMLFSYLKICFWTHGNPTPENIRKSFLCMALWMLSIELWRHKGNSVKQVKGALSLLKLIALSDPEKCIRLLNDYGIIRRLGLSDKYRQIEKAINKVNREAQETLDQIRTAADSLLGASGDVLGSS